MYDVKGMSIQSITLGFQYLSRDRYLLRAESEMLDRNRVDRAFGF
ncbi:Uncharacterised protein [Nocardia brasiliensis]|nr:Uncharacterised protein [Nocardia brasiliensis]